MSTPHTHEMNQDESASQPTILKNPKSNAEIAAKEGGDAGKRREAKMDKFKLNRLDTELELISGRNQFLRSTNDESSALQSIIKRQAYIMRKMEKAGFPVINSDDTDSPQSDPSSEFDSRSGWEPSFELLSDHMWSDSDETSLPATSSGSCIHDSIEAIREEASRVDAVIALDKLDTMKGELASLKKELTTRDSEIRDLQAKMMAKDSQLSTLQLERALYKADVGDESFSVDSSELYFIPMLSPSLSADYSPDSEAHSSPPPPPPPAKGRESASGRFPALKREGTVHPLLKPTLNRSSTLSPRRSNSSGTRPPRQIIMESSPLKAPRAGDVVPTTTTARVETSVVKIDPVLESQGSVIQLRRHTPTNSMDSQLPYQFLTRQHEMVHPLSTQVTSSNRVVTTPEDHRQRRSFSGSMEGSNLLHIPQPDFGSPKPCQLLYDEVPPPPEEATVTKMSLHHTDGSGVSSRTSFGRKSVGSRVTLQDDKISYDPFNDSLEQKSNTRSRRSESAVRPRSAVDDIGTKVCFPMVPFYPRDDAVGSKSCFPMMPKPKALLSRHRRKSTSASPSTTSSSHPTAATTATATTHADEVAQLLRSSLETSEELRKRLAMISSYYENVLYELRLSLRTSDAQRKKMERDLLKQIETLERAERKEKKRGGYGKTFIFSNESFSSTGEL